MSQRKIVAATPSGTLRLLAFIAVVLVIGVAVGGLFFLPRIQSQQTLEQHYQAGVAFQNVSDWTAAEGEYKQVIVLDATYKDAQSRLAEVKTKLAGDAATATAVAIAQAGQAQAQLQATAAAAKATVVAGPTATAEALEMHYQKGVGYMNMSQWAEAKTELDLVFATAPNYKEVQAKLTEVRQKLSELALLTPTLTLTPPSPPTPTPVPPSVKLTPADRHPGEVNLLESNKALPVDWFGNGQYTYWEGFLHVQDEPFIDITITDCGDNEGNGRLDIVQVFDPDGTPIADYKNCDGNLKFRVRTYQMPGYYRVFIQDNDTGRDNGNGGGLHVDMLKDTTISQELAVTLN